MIFQYHNSGANICRPAYDLDIEVGVITNIESPHPSKSACLDSHDTIIKFVLLLRNYYRLIIVHGIFNIGDLRVLEIQRTFCLFHGPARHAIWILIRVDAKI